jgi:hypothetical protein
MPRERSVAQVSEPAVSPISNRQGARVREVCGLETRDTADLEIGATVAVQSRARANPTGIFPLARRADSGKIHHCPGQPQKICAILPQSFLRVASVPDCLLLELAHIGLG